MCRVRTGKCLTFFIKFYPHFQFYSHLQQRGKWWQSGMFLWLNVFPISFSGGLCKSGESAGVLSFHGENRSRYQRLLWNAGGKEASVNTFLLFTFPASSSVQINFLQAVIIKQTLGFVPRNFIFISQVLLTTFWLIFNAFYLSMYIFLRQI